MARHADDQHRFSPLDWPFGPNGPRDLHFHHCLAPTCLRLLVGPGERCDHRSPHWLQNDRDRRPVEAP